MHAARAARAISFGAWADEYDDCRPSYPHAAVEWLLDGARRVVEAGAGTGKLTDRLVEFDDICVDVTEIDGRMLRLITERHPTLPAHQAGATNLPFVGVRGPADAGEVLLREARGRCERGVDRERRRGRGREGARRGTRATAGQARTLASSHAPAQPRLLAPEVRLGLREPLQTARVRGAPLRASARATSARTRHRSGTSAAASRRAASRDRGRRRATARSSRRVVCSRTTCSRCDGARISGTSSALQPAEGAPDRGAERRQRLRLRRRLARRAQLAAQPLAGAVEPRQRAAAPPGGSARAAASRGRGRRRSRRPAAAGRGRWPRAAAGAARRPRPARCGCRPRRARARSIRPPALAVGEGLERGAGALEVRREALLDGVRALEVRAHLGALRALSAAAPAREQRREPDAHDTGPQRVTSGPAPRSRRCRPCGGRRASRAPCRARSSSSACRCRTRSRTGSSVVRIDGRLELAGRDAHGLLAEVGGDAGDAEDRVVAARARAAPGGALGRPHRRHDRVEAEDHQVQRRDEVARAAELGQLVLGRRARAAPTAASRRSAASRTRRRRRRGSGPRRA